MSNNPIKMNIDYDGDWEVDKDGNITFSRPEPDKCSVCGEDIPVGMNYNINVLTGFVSCGREHKIPMEFRTIDIKDSPIISRKHDYDISSYPRLEEIPLPEGMIRCKCSKCGRPYTRPATKSNDASLWIECSQCGETNY